ncbi:hypothetical protein BGY98DRAFT_963350 [Russula aff. rugulosa BPL654]|nr:hypothetical protein BGY98DRAFT_963350 [Russula aff. rugulosa BPL654]
MMMSISRRLLTAVAAERRTAIPVKINPAGGNAWPTDSAIVPENATMTFTVGFNQFDSLSESLSLRDR